MRSCSDIAKAPRPWLTRRAGECAFPVGGEGWDMRSCCNPCVGAEYCPAHRRLVYRPAILSVADIEAHLRACGLCR